MIRRKSGKAALVGVVVLALAACGDGGEEESTAPAGEETEEPTEAGGGEASLTLVAENVSFDRSELSVPAGEEVTITYDNRDSVTHNLRINELDGVATEIVNGPVEQTLTFTAPDSGQLTYQCDVHPGQMNGVINMS